MRIENETNWPGEEVAAHLVSDGELAGFDAGGDWISRVAALSLHQRANWPMLAKGHATLATVQVRRFEFDGFEVRTQFNPGRMASAVANVDPKALQERKCFLCRAQLPAEQKGLRYGDFLILCNPFPILAEHFTVNSIEHRPQRIGAAFDVFLKLALDLGSAYTILYNGPKAGASAPDHLHLQAGTRGWMPADTEYAGLRDRHGERVATSDGVKVWAISDYLRPVVGLEGEDAGAIQRVFRALCDALQEVCPADDEPMMNMLAWFDAGKWTVVIFPRARHRPSCFFEEGDGKILVSPGAVDVAGVLITPLAESFDRLNHETIRKILSEVCLSTESFLELKSRLKARLSG